MAVLLEKYRFKVIENYINDVYPYSDYLKIRVDKKLALKSVSPKQKRVIEINIWSKYAWAGNIEKSIKKGLL
ncbi:MAG: hypothetical protein KAU21_09025 [Gammaproteobacteria bacterium]|nr:hypothetical protein [Gammaproteobacteria bacterium]